MARLNLKVINKVVVEGHKQQDKVAAQAAEEAEHRNCCAAHRAGALVRICQCLLGSVVPKPASILRVSSENSLSPTP